MTMAGFSQAIVNGNFVPVEQAVISIDERGFRFGDGVFETIPVHHGIPYLWEYHRERLETGLKALRIACNTETLQEQAMALIRANGSAHCLLRIYVSRGIGSRGYLPLSATAMPTVVLQSLPMPSRPGEAVRLWQSSYEKISPRALPVHCKLAQGLNATLARMEALDHNCHEALQLDAGSYIAEASSANIFWLKAGRLHTPALACGALAGVTRRRLMELSPYPVEEGHFRLGDLKEADAVLLTNASLGLVHVASLQPKAYEWGETPQLRQLMQLYRQDIARYCEAVRESLA